MCFIGIVKTSPFPKYFLTSFLKWENMKERGAMGKNKNNNKKIEAWK